MAAVTSFHSAVATHLPAAPTPTIDEAIVNAAIDFCTRTQLVVETVTADADVGEALVYFTPSSDDLNIRFISAVWYEQTQMSPVAEPYVYTPNAFTGEGGATGPSRYFYAAESNFITVYPVPNANVTDAFTARVIVVPTRTATTLPDVLYDEWLTTIAAGARAYIKAIPGQPFSSDFKLDIAQFQQGVSLAMTQALRGRVGANVGVRVGITGPKVFFAKRY